MDGPNDQNLPEPAPRSEDGNQLAEPAGMGTYAQTSPPPERHMVRNITAGLLALALLAAAGFGIYSKFLKNKGNSTPPAQTASSQQTSTKAASKIASETAHYDSTNFNLGFDYPKDWTVTDAAGSGILTAVSPSMQLTNSSGQTVTGQVVLKIRDKTQKLTEFNSGNATATRDSLKIAYTKPTQTQRGSTYLSFLQYAASGSGLDGIYITGDNGYQKGQAIPLVDITKVDPVISIIFQDSSSKQMSIAASMWDDQSFSGPLTSLLKSLSIT